MAGYALRRLISSSANDRDAAVQSYRCRESARRGHRAHKAKLPNPELRVRDAGQRLKIVVRVAPLVMYDFIERVGDSALCIEMAGLNFCWYQPLDPSAPRRGVPTLKLNLAGLQRFLPAYALPNRSGRQEPADQHFQRVGWAPISGHSHRGSPPCSRSLLRGLFEYL